MPRLRLALLCALIVAALAPQAALARPARSLPVLSLPTPVGEPWKVLQGYACGTHNSWDRYSLDLVSAAGRTTGAPVRAAADGIVFVWAKKSGTLILDHGDGVYTQYTHLASAAMTRMGAHIARGEVLGAAGDRGSPGTPHLHFTAFTAEGASARNRQSFALTFAEGYQLPEIGGCSQHQGAELVAQAGAGAPGVRFESPVAPGAWTNRDLTIGFGGDALARGYRVAWGGDPGGDGPAITARGGLVQIAEAGEGLHTLYLRGWGADGAQTLATYGPVGYDVTPPTIAALAEPLRARAGAALEWPAAGDSASGVAGYRIYLGADPQGTSEWFSAAPRIDALPLAAGEALLRLQPIDYAGNAGAWVTVARLIIT